MDCPSRFSYLEQHARLARHTGGLFRLPGLALPCLALCSFARRATAWNGVQVEGLDSEGERMLAASSMGFRYAMNARTVPIHQEI